jgi:hypothetical protein
MYLAKLLGTLEYDTRQVDTNMNNKEINTVTPNQCWIIRKPITIKNFLEELISILALEQEEHI